MSSTAVPVPGKVAGARRCSLRRHGFGQRPDGIGVACEAVKYEHAASHRRGEGLGTGKDGAMMSMLRRWLHWPAQTLASARVPGICPTVRGAGIGRSASTFPSERQ